MSISHRIHSGRNAGRPAAAAAVAFGVLVGLLAAGCDAPGASHTPDAVVRDSVGVLIVEYPGQVLDIEAPFLLAPEPDIRIGVIEGADFYQWTRPIGAARLSDGAFVIAEQLPSELRIFDAEGTFVRRIGGAGDGPGEFGALAAVAALPGDTLLTWDTRSRRLSWFARDGALVREATMREPGGVQVIRGAALGPGRGAVILGSVAGAPDLANQGRVRESWELVPISAEGVAGSSLGQVPGAEFMINIEGSGGGAEGITSIAIYRWWWWGEGFAWSSTSGLWTGDRLALELRHFDRDEGLNRILRVAAPERPFTRALIDSLEAIELERVTDEQQRDLLRDGFLLREYPEGVPPVAAVFADRADRVWVGLTDIPQRSLPSGGLPAVRRWLVFEDDADVEHPALLGRVDLPPLSHPLWADESGALLVRNDEEFGVAFVEWYPYLR